MALVIESVNHTFSNPVSGDESGVNLTENYLVLFTKASVDSASAAELSHAETIAYFANGIPQIGQQNSFNRAAFCKGKSANAIVTDNKPIGVNVNCTYSTIGSDKKDESDNPLEKAPDITWSPMFEREVVESAREINVFQGGGGAKQNVPGGGGGFNNFTLPITNSFGDKFATQPEKEVPYMQWTIVQNLLFFDVKQAIKLLQTVNHESFKLDGYTITKGQNLLTQRSASIKYAGNFSYREVTTSGIIKLNHDVQVLDNGDKAYIDTSNKFNSGKDLGTQTKVDGREAVAALDGKGNILEQGKDPVFISFKVYSQADHSDLGLPTVRL